MSIEILKRFFNIDAKNSFLDGKFVRYMANESIYTLVPVTNVQEELLVELFEMSEHLISQGDRYVSKFISSKENKFLVTSNDVDYVLLQNHHSRLPRSLDYGRKLAKFHYRGRSIQTEIQIASRIGQWKSFWEKRLDQLEKVWYQMVQEHPNQDFEHLFIDSFPYYMGLSENAIQYLVDTELDDQPIQIDAGTVCHERFNKKSWGENQWIRNPFDWVFDHPSRDIAEWIREQYFRNKRTFLPDIQDFLRSYQTINPLSSFSWRLLYARLLFPLHYFECIEEYFITDSEQHQKVLEERLRIYMRDSSEYEKFLGDFFQMAEVSNGRNGIPKVDWLTN